MKDRFTTDELKRLAARSHCATETVRKYPNVSEVRAIRIREAAKAEGIELPTVTTLRVISDVGVQTGKL